MVNHIRVHRANAQPLVEYPVLAGQATTPSPNTNANTATGTGTPDGPSGTAKTSSGAAATPTGNTSAAPNPSTSTATGTTSSTTDGGLLGGLLSTQITLGSSSSTTSTAISTSPVTTPTSGPAQITSVAAQSGSPSLVSTIFQTLSPSSSSSPAPPPSTSNPDAGPIAGGVIGGLFAVAALGMFISFLLRRRRRKQIDKEILGADIFGGSGYRSSTILLDEAKGGTDSDKFIPRPPSMIERRVGTPGNSDPVKFAGAPYGAPATFGSGGYNDSNAYGAPAPGYPPQPMQRGYYPQGQQQPPHSSHNAHFQQVGYNQAYAYNQPQGGPQVPSRAHTPQVPGHHHMAAQPPCPPPAHELPNPFGARSDAGHGGHNGSVESAGAAATRERRQSGQSDYGHHPSEELPAYGFGFDETKYAELHRDSKPRPDSVDFHGAAM